MVIKPIRDIDFFFAGASWELAALQHYHELIESNLPQLSNARRLPGWEEGGQITQNIGMEQFRQTMLSGMLPSMLRAPLMLSLWAIYESTLIEMAEFLRVRAGLPFGLAKSDIPKHIKLQSSGILGRALHIYEVELGLSLFGDPQMEEGIRNFYRLRNLLAHAGGHRVSAKPADWENVNDWASQQSGLDLSGNVVRVEAEFVRLQIIRVGNATRHIVQQVRERLPILGIARSD